MIQIRGLSKRYGSKYAVQDVTFDINEGEVLGFLGRNGAGKTTTMNIITGYISATEGTVTVDGYDVLKDPKEVKRRIGYLPELPPVYGDMTVNEYLHFACDIKGITRSKQNKHLDEICELMRIDEVRRRLIRNLSKGYKQRVGFAQAMVGNPDVLIFDEPTVGLDPRQIIEIRRLIKELGKTHTVVLSSHILHEVADICERIVIIHKGNIVAQDSLEGLVNSQGGNNQFELRIAGQERIIRRALHDIPGVRSIAQGGSKEEGAFDFVIQADPGSDIRRQVFNSMARIASPILLFKPTEVTLEDVFIKLTREDDSEVI